MDVGVLAKIEGEQVKAAAADDLQQDLKRRSHQSLTAVGNQAVANDRQIMHQFGHGTVGLRLCCGLGSPDGGGL